LAPFIDQLLSIFAFVLDPEANTDMLGDETRRGVLEHVALFNAQVPDKVVAAGLSVYL